MRRVRDNPEYNVWLNMRRRCNDPSNRAYDNYGGRGIKVCAAWNRPGSFWQFLEDVGTRPSQDLTLDRINNDGNYEPGNVRWATRSVQSINQRIRRDNRSGFKGVYFDKKVKKWAAILNTRPRKWLGYFETPGEAHQARVNS